MSRGTVMSQAGGDVSAGFGARERVCVCVRVCSLHIASPRRSNDTVE